MKKIKVLVVDPLKGVEEKVIENKLETFYEIIDCQCIDIATRTIGAKKKYYDIICDDEGLLFDKKPSAINDNLRVMLVGTLIITNYNSNGETISLEDSDIEYLKPMVKQLFHMGYNRTLNVLTQVNF